MNNIVDSENNTNFANNENNGKQSDSEVPLGSSQEELRGMHDIQQEMQEYVDRLGERISKAERERQEPLTFHERQDIEKRTALEYAKKKGIWHDDFYSLGNRVMSGGNENSLIVDEPNLDVYKANNLMNSKGSISTLFDMIDNHNHIFPETKYEFVGFTGIDNGKNRVPYIEPIFKQSYIPNATQATPQEIEDYMKSLGFEKINDTTFTNGEYEVSDLHPRNVLKDADGNIHVVDDAVRPIEANESNTIRFQTIDEVAESVGSSMTPSLSGGTQTCISRLAMSIPAELGFTIFSVTPLLVLIFLLSLPCEVILGK